MSTNPLVLSEPKLNVEGGQVQISEILKGRAFHLSATFPAGFRAAPGQNIELRVKSNHPQVPWVRIPVFQEEPANETSEPATPPAGGTNAAASQLTAPPAQAVTPESKPVTVQK